MKGTRFLRWAGIALAGVVGAYLVACIVWDLTEPDVTFSDIPTNPFTAPLHWSLIDNFEWSEGFGPRFGLHRVDYETFARFETAGAEQFRRPAIGLNK